MLVLLAIRKISWATGLWLNEVEIPTFQSFVGEQPAEVSATTNGSDLISIKTNWSGVTAGNTSLLRQAKIAIVVEP